MVDPVVLSGITSMADGIQKRADGFLKRYPGADYGNMGSMSSAQCTRRARELERKSKTAGYEISGLKDDFAILTARAARDTKQGRPDPLAKVTLDQAQGGAMDAILRCEAAASSYGKQAGVLREQAATKREMEIIENGGKGGGGRGLLQSMGSPLIKVLSGAVAAGVIVGGFLLAKPLLRGGKSKKAVAIPINNRSMMSYLDDELYYDDRAPADILKECAEALVQGIERIGCAI
eukprot:CAMPEP_0182908548 /NCGR_PEP_ID=MMETSP0034_2-20130328/35271_1 /TAXON_ID=156128 /ORGANISM="Nephroselmis pyriformis, Strain CCMP717" /LENGTH=233 /DNA_ID=CAMNT_0025044735 /DNA_START=40 /DNA_END=738 /DNA_ORIENTATION=-